MPINTSTSSPGSSRSSPTTSRRGSWDCEKMSTCDYNEKDQEIYMGALVSPGSGDWEKSIEVPCIILSTSTFYFKSILPYLSHYTLAISTIPEKV
jgi:hypothetical protein